MDKPVIFGSGVAGLSLGIMLAQQGFNIPIYTRLPKKNEFNGLLWIAPNGLAILERMGLIEDIYKYGHVQQSMEFANKELKTYISLDCDKLERKHRFPIIAISRQDLLKVLTSKFESLGGKIFYDHKVLGCEKSKEDNEIFVKLREGRDNRIEKFSHVFACDGKSSVFRNLLGSKGKITEQPIVATLGRSKIRNAEKYIGRTIEAWGVGTRFVMTSVDGQHVHVSALTKQDLGFEALGDSLKRMLTERFTSYHPDIVEAIDNLDCDQVYNVRFSNVSGLRKYAKDNVCLLGDAAHAMPPNMGQGASLALEDAYNLAENYRATKKWDSMMFSYNAKRPKRVRSIAKVANMMNQYFQPSGALFASLRNGLAKVYPSSLFQMQGSSNYKLPATRKKGFFEPTVDKVFSLMKLTHLSYKTEMISDENIDESSKFLAQQFCKYEQLSAALDLNPVLMEDYFKELLTHIKSHKLSFILRDKKSQMIAVSVSEDHDDLYVPSDKFSSEPFQILGELFEQSHGCFNFNDKLKKWNAYHNMLVTVDRTKTKKSILAFIFMQMSKIANDRGYNLGYAEISHPGINKGIDKINNLVGTEVIKEVAKLHIDRSRFVKPELLKKNSNLSMNVWKHDLAVDPFSEIFH